MSFGEKIQRLRRDAGISQEEFAERLNVSRQAVSRWENDSGYPETEKLVRIAQMFQTSLDYLLKDGPADEAQPGGKGFYVSRELAEGFLRAEQMRSFRLALGVALLIAGTSFTFFSNGVFGPLAFLLAAIAAVALFISRKLAGKPYARLWKEPLVFDDAFQKQLHRRWLLRGRQYRNLILAGVVTFGVFLLVLPMFPESLAESIARTETGRLDAGRAMYAIGMVGAGAGWFLILYFWGLFKSLRLLAGNREYWGTVKKEDSQ